jgi:hypothetical protein
LAEAVTLRLFAKGLRKGGLTSLWAKPNIVVSSPKGGAFFL